MIGFRTKRQRTTTLNGQRVDPSRALYVFIDPADGSQSVAPESGDFFIIDVNGKERAFLFDEFKGDNCGNCAKCSLGNENSDYSNAVCRKMLCLTNGVYGREYAYNNDDEVFEPLQPNDDDSNTDPEPEFEPEPEFDAEPEPESIDDDSEPPIVDEPEPEHKTPEQRRADWERALRKLEAEAQKAAEQAAEYKTLSKQAAKHANELRAQILDILWRGSENYQSSTPLFDAFDDNEEGAF